MFASTLRNLFYVSSQFIGSNFIRPNSTMYEFKLRANKSKNLNADLLLSIAEYAIWIRKWWLVLDLYAKCRKIMLYPFLNTWYQLHSVIISFFLLAPLDVIMKMNDKYDLELGCRIKQKVVKPVWQIKYMNK